MNSEYIFLTISAILLTGIAVFAVPSTSSDRDIQILREEIYRQELVLAALKEKLSKMEKEGVVDRLIIEIDGDGFKFQGEFLPESELKKKIEEIPVEQSVLIIADKTAPFRRVVAVMNLLREEKITNVTLSASNSEPCEGGMEE